MVAFYLFGTRRKNFTFLRRAQGGGWEEEQPFC